MIALADASDMPTAPLWVYPALALLLTAGLLLHHALTNAPQVPPAHDPAPVEHCTHHDCNNPVTTHVHAGHDWWPFCAEHGIPYLTKGMKR